MKEIYENLFDYYYNFQFEFKKKEIVFTVENYKNYATFRCKTFDNIPRIGENITLPFLKAKVGTDYFYVQDIRHFYEADKHVIDIYLKGGSYNSYWYHRKHKALELGEIGIMDSYDLYDFQIKEKLGRNY